MCCLTEPEKGMVAAKVTFLLTTGVPFTGLAVTHALRTEGVELPHGEVSAYAREIFNKGGMPGWASTQVVPGLGPVMYFPVPPRSEAGLAAARIRKGMGR